MKGFLLDTNVFNHLVEGKITIEDLPTEFPVFITHIQRDEILQCKDAEKIKQMINWLDVLPNSEEPLETFVVGIGRVGAARLGDGNYYQRILEALNIKKKRKNNANVHDALLGEVALKNDLILITNDRDLGEIVRSLGGYVRNVVK